MPLAGSSGQFATPGQHVVFAVMILCTVGGLILPWDLELSAAVRDRKRALLEETDIPTLLSDLNDSRARR